MAKLTFLMNFNNYYNRTIKNYNNLDTNVITYVDIDNINFNPNNDLTTEQIVNWESNWVPNYVLVNYNGTTADSGWFILDWTRTRKNQYRASLKKDVIASNLSAISNSPVFINKAIIADPNDPAVYNKEDINVNQIKKSEYPIVEADSQNGKACPLNWIVGYATKQKGDAANWTEQTLQIASVANEFNSWSDFPFAAITTNQDRHYTAIRAESKYVGLYVACTDYMLGQEKGWATSQAYYGSAVTLPTNPKVYSWSVWANPNIAIDSSRFAQFVSLPTNLKNSNAPGTDYQGSYGSGYRFMPLSNLLNTNLTSTVKTHLNDYLHESLSESYNYDQVDYWDGKTIKVGANYYKLTVQYEDVNEIDQAANLSQSVVDELFNNYTRVWPGSGMSGWSGSPTNTNVFFGVKGRKFNVYYQQTAAPTVTIAPADPNSATEEFRTYNFKNIPYVDDAPYCIFAIPYTEEWHDTLMNIRGPFDNTASHQGTREVSRARAFTLAQYIANQLQEGQFLIDMQILPYAPFDVHMMLNQTIDLSYLPTTHGHLFYMKNENNEYSAYYPCFFAEKSDHYHIGGIWNGQLGNACFADVGFNLDVIDKKIMNQCDFFRLNSPSKSQFYDFSPAMNNGMSTMYIDFTYKPYQPFIYIKPKTYEGSLYGVNTQDYVGLISTGDYSMPLLTDQWKTYQINNKNFQKTFDRQVQHQEFENKWALAESITNMFTAPLQGAVSGASTGAMASGGNPYAAAGGAIIGGAIAQIGSIADFGKTISSQKENMSYMKDMFNYSIENIQALPDTLSSTTGFDAVNKIYPFVEYYSCFEKEKEAVRNKILYSGMTVHRIDFIRNFVTGTANNYTEGMLIRLENTNTNPLELNEINTELMKGVYL